MGSGFYLEILTLYYAVFSAGWRGDILYERLKIEIESNFRPILTKTDHNKVIKRRAEPIKIGVGPRKRGQGLEIVGHPAPFFALVKILLYGNNVHVIQESLLQSKQYTKWGNFIIKTLKIIS